LKTIELLVHRCEKCVEIKGDYTAKYQNYFTLNIGQAGYFETYPVLHSGPTKGSRRLNLNVYQKQQYIYVEHRNKIRRKHKNLKTST
jgi:hypothetical protein